MHAFSLLSVLCILAAATCSNALAQTARADQAVTPAAKSHPSSRAEGRDEPPRLLEQAADYSERTGGRAMLVMIDGRTIYERYGNGWRANLPHPLASGSKSFAGSVAAALIEDGMLAWDENVSDTITQWKDDEQKRNITVRMLLNLSSGLAPSEDALQGPGGRGLLGGRAKPDRVAEAPDRFEYALTVPINHTPGSKFQYGPSHFYAFGALVERKLAIKRAADPTFTDRNYEAYMNRRILEPAGVTISHWGRDTEGNPNLPGGALMTAAEWATYGEFIRHQGAVIDANGQTKQVIAWDVLRECFTPSTANPSYGLTWWLVNGTPTDAAFDAADNGGEGTNATPASRLRRAARDRIQREMELDLNDPSGKPLDIYLAAGKGKQRLFIIPQLKLTVVRFAKDSREGNAFSNGQFLKPIVTFAMERQSKTQAAP